MKQTSLTLLLMAGVLAAADAPQRPKITGVAHLALYVHDLAKSRQFYRDFLGYEEPFQLKRPDGTDRIAFIKVNDRQYFELFAEEPKEGWKDGRMNHISLETDDANGMRGYLAAQGVTVPDKVGIGQIKNANFNIKDPDGHTVEIVQYKSDGWSMLNQGKFMPDTRISDRMAHVGVLIARLDPAIQFYRGILGFQELWRGGAGKTLSWVNMRVPDGPDYLEFMLYDKEEDDAQKGVKHHACLFVPDVQKAVAILETRRARANYDKPLKPKVGVNRKRQVNLFDPDGTRIELMEPDTIDGQPTPPSTAPPPR